MSKGVGIMNKQARALVLRGISLKNEDMRGCGPDPTNMDRPYKLPNIDYIDKMMALNIVVCWHCMDEIKDGDHYEHKKKRDRVSKYFHSSCYESMFY